MKLLIDDAKAAFLEMAALCGCYAEGKSVYRDKCPLHCDATIDGFLTDRRTLLARIAELEKERDHWKANHDNQVQLSQLLRDRPDLSVERTHAYRQFEALQKRAADLDYANSILLDVRSELNDRIAELEKERDAMWAALEKIAEEPIRSVIMHRVREQLSEIEKADEPGDFTKGNY